MEQYTRDGYPSGGCSVEDRCYVYQHKGLIHNLKHEVGHFLSRMWFGSTQTKCLAISEGIAEYFMHGECDCLTHYAKCYIQNSQILDLDFIFKISTYSYKTYNLGHLMTVYVLKYAPQSIRDVCLASDTLSYTIQKFITNY